VTDRARNWLIVVVVAVALGCVVFLSNGARQSADRASRATENVTASLRRRSPITDYTTAWFEHTDCRKNHEDRFLADVAAALAANRNDTAAIAQLQARIAQDQSDLASIEQICPTPTPPEFDAQGNQITPTTTRPGG